MERRIRQWMMAFLLGALALGNVACSTPPVPDVSDDHNYETTMNSYENCVQRTYPADRGYACDTAVSSASSSRLQYMGTTANAYYGPNLSKTAWAEYVKQLDKESQDELKAQWDEIAGEAVSDVASDAGEAVSDASAK
jgi:hypothetical protein